MGSLTFGARNLHDYTNYHLHGADLPAVQVGLSIEQLAGIEAASLTLIRYPSAIASLQGVVEADTEALVRAARDDLLKDLSNGEQQLRLGLDDERYWLARLQQATFTRINDGAYRYSAEMALLRPFAYANAANSSVVNNSALTLVTGSHYSKSLSVPVGGNVFTWPTITIAVPGGGPYGLTSVWVVNAQTSQVLTVLRTYAVSETLIIETDIALQTVKVNGVAVDYFGGFPYLNPQLGATNDIEIHATATSVPTLNVTIASRNRYL